MKKEKEANPLINLILNKLKKSSIYNGDEKNPNIVIFSDDDVFPPAPYVVIKPEIGISENTRTYRIIVHMKKGFFDKLEKYTLKELDTLLLTDYLIDEEGSRYKLHPSGFTDITPEKIDNTYFMERLYSVPMLIRD